MRAPQTPRADGPPVADASVTNHERAGQRYNAIGLRDRMLPRNTVTPWRDAWCL